MTIKSNINEASERATSLKNATTKLNKTMVVELDTSTTVLGNSNAKEVLEINQQTTKSIANSITQASTNIKSVAEDFEALDRRIGKLVGGAYK